MRHITILIILYFQSMKRLIAIPNFIEQSVFRFICDSKILAKKYSNLKINKKSSWSLEIIKHRILPHCSLGIIVSGSLKLLALFWPYGGETQTWIKTLSFLFPLKSLIEHKKMWRLWTWQDILTPAYFPIWRDEPYPAVS